jgi:hypothetical protein
MRMEGTEKAGLAEIDPKFDLNASFIENLMRILSGEDDKAAGSTYYTGGRVTTTEDVAKLIRSLKR